MGTVAGREGAVKIPIAISSVLALKALIIKEGMSLFWSWFPWRYSWSRAWVEGRGWGKMMIHLDTSLLAGSFLSLLSDLRAPPCHPSSFRVLCLLYFLYNTCHWLYTVTCVPDIFYSLKIKLCKGTDFSYSFSVPTKKIILDLAYHSRLVKTHE